MNENAVDGSVEKVFIDLNSKDLGYFQPSWSGKKVDSVRSQSVPDNWKNDLADATASEPSSKVVRLYRLANLLLLNLLRAVLRYFCVYQGCTASSLLRIEVVLQITAVNFSTFRFCLCKISLQVSDALPKTSILKKSASFVGLLFSV